jgi:hypothetical protein
MGSVVPESGLEPARFPRRLTGESRNGVRCVFLQVALRANRQRNSPDVPGWSRREESGVQRQELGAACPHVRHWEQSEREFIRCKTTRQSRRGGRDTWPVHCNPCFEVATPVTLPTDSGRITCYPVSLFVCGALLDSGASVPRSPDLPVFRIVGSKLAVQGRYNENLLLNVLTVIYSALQSGRCLVITT